MSKKGKGKKGPAEKVYTFLTYQEMEAREQKFTNHVRELKVCLDFMDEAIALVAKIDAEQLLTDKWINFVTCYPLPKPYIPGDVRLYKTKLKYFENLCVEKNIDWTLSVDERSILTQDIFRKDLSRKTLIDTIKPDFGNEYCENIDNCLQVLKQIRYFLNNDVEVAKCKKSILEDIKDIKKDIENEVENFFNRLTYRILSSEDAYTVSIDSITAEYGYSTDNFEIDVWCLKNVPIRFKQLEQPFLLADFPSIHVVLIIPAFMLRQNMAIRGLHMNFDHITEYAKSYFQEITVPVDNLSAGIENLPECLLNEWLMQLNIQNRVCEAMRQKRAEYDEKVRLFEEEEAKKKAKKGDEDEKNKKAKKIVKPTKEPPLIGPECFPDVWTDFLIEEHNEYKHFINIVYNPDSLGLDPDEINLKKYFILGGIYQFYYVSKPKHTDFNASGFNMTWHKDDTKTLIIDKNVVARGHYMNRRSTRLSRRISTMDMLSDKHEEEMPVDDMSPWFVLTFKIPEYLTYWGEPIACHYETVTKILEIKKEEQPPPEHIKKKKKGGGQTPQTPQTPASQNQSEAENKEPKKEAPSESTSPFITFLEPLKTKRSQGSFKTSIEFTGAPEIDISKARDADGVLNINDFELTRFLNKSEVRHITRHLIPRIISSYKFPKEIKEYNLEAAIRPKMKGGGTLVRKQVTAIEEEEKAKLSQNLLTYNIDQNNPERLFSIYSTEEPVRILQRLHKDPAELEPKSFSQLMDVIDHIKSCFMSRINDTLTLRPFTSKFKIEAKRAKSVSKGSNFAITSRKSEQRSTKTSLMSTDNSIKESSSENTAAFESKPKINAAEVEEPTKITVTHWTTKHIKHFEYDKSKCQIVIHTDRLGHLGFAFKRYEHFPFKYWKLEPCETDPENEVVFTLETQFVKCVLNINGNGIRGYVTEPTTGFKRNPKMYLVIEKPMKDYIEFKKRFKENYLNIFADHDACYYIENGYFCEKHLATEMHTYNCMAINSTQMKFNFSQWNRLSKRRDLILQFMQYKDMPDNMVEVRITPEEATFVEISELCSDDVDVIKLRYNLTWRNINTYSDLSILIDSMYPAASDLRTNNPKLITCIRDLLKEIRPLSFS